MAISSTILPNGEKTYSIPFISGMTWLLLSIGPNANNNHEGQSWTTWKGVRSEQWTPAGLLVIFPLKYLTL